MAWRQKWLRRASDALDGVTDFPWRTTAATLWERFREDRLGVTASSLTYTTVLALVPLFAVALSIFTAFPLFGQFQRGLEDWLITNLVPRSIAEPVLGYLTQFAGKASQLGSVSVVFLLITSLALMNTVDHTLQGIWRVRRQRSLGQRILIYWAALTLAPLVLGGSVAITSYLVTASRGVVDRLPLGLSFLLDLLQFVMMAGGMTLLYRFVPATWVRWSHALAGGVFVALALALARWGLTAYLARIPTYSLIYGAFATVPILLLWTYIAWLIVLLGAVVAAYLPALTAGVSRRPGSSGWPFELALELLRLLAHAREGEARGSTLPWMAEQMRVDTLQLVPVLETLVALDWVGLLDEGGDGGTEPRHVLLADPETTPLAPLIERLLLERNAATQALWHHGGLGRLMLRDVL